MLIYKMLLALATLLFLALVVLCGWVFLYTGDLPDINHLSEFASGRYYATDACLAGLSFVVPSDEIGKSFQDALVSAEPRDSFPYQIARTLMCNRHESPARYQLDVFRLSWHIRRHFSQEDVFTIYVNRAYFGPGAMGIQNAAEHFFQRDANTLSTEEAALLAGLLRSPAIFSPFSHPDMASRRRNKVLEMMAAQGKLTVAEAAAAERTRIITRSEGNTEEKPLPHGVLAADQSAYCDEFDGDFKKGCEETFRVNLVWVPLQVVPQGNPAILLENHNRGFCGSAGCALSLFVAQPNGQFIQTLGPDGDVGSLARIAVLKTITNGHHDVQKTWADGRTHTIYRWRGSGYSVDQNRLVR